MSDFCTECSGQGTVPVEMNDGTQYRTCLSCMGRKPPSEKPDPTVKPLVPCPTHGSKLCMDCLRPLACAETGANEEYRVGIKDAVGSRPW
jgi:hypothetical protein